MSTRRQYKGQDRKVVWRAAADIVAPALFPGSLHAQRRFAVSTGPDVRLRYMSIGNLGGHLGKRPRAQLCWTAE